MARIISIDFPEAPVMAATALDADKLVVFPTDTVYGVAARLGEAAIERIFAAKKRAIDKAIPVLLAEPDAVTQVAQSFPDWAQQLAAQFWPGPLTLVLPRRDDLPASLSALATVGVRVPDFTFARTLIAEAGGALAVTSANRSDQPPACTVQAAIRYLSDAVALYVDGGACAGGVPSTVVTMTGDGLRVLREGPISAHNVRAVLATD